MTALAPRNRIPIINDSGFDIPPFSVVLVNQVEIEETGTGQEWVALHRVIRYAGQDGNILVTGRTPIFDGRRGVAYSDQFIYVCYDTSTIPQPGKEWGPVANQWYVGPSGRGFFCQGAADTGDAYARSMFYRGNNRYGWYYASNTSIITAPSSIIATPTVFNADMYFQNVTGPPPYKLVRTSDPGLQGVACVNYDPSLSTSSTGKLCKLEWDGYAWSLRWIGC